MLASAHLRIPPLIFLSIAPLLPPFLAQILLRVLHPSRRPYLVPSLPRSFPSSTLPPSLPPALPPSLPPSPTSLRSNPLGSRAPHPTQCRPTSCVCVAWRAALCRFYWLAPSDVWHWHNGGGVFISADCVLSMTRCYIQRTYVHHESVFFTNSKKSEIEKCYKHT